MVRHTRPRGRSGALAAVSLIRFSLVATALVTYLQDGKQHHMPAWRRPDRISRLYDRIGDTGWRESDYFTFSFRSLAFRRWIAARLPAKSSNILSVGCGTGELERHLSGTRHNVACIDTSQRMLKRSRDRGLKLLVRADSHNLPFGDGCFGCVLFVECVGHLHMPTAFKEAWRVLGRGGQLLITTYSGGVTAHASYTKFRLREIASSLNGASFRITEHRFLNITRTSVTEVPSDDESTLLYVLSTKQTPGMSGCDTPA